MMNNLIKLLNRCKCGVYVTVNPHRDNYQSSRQYLENLEMGDPMALNIPDAVRDVMETTDTVVSIIFYPDTPIGSYHIYHFDISEAIEAAIACLPNAEVHRAASAPVQHLVGQSLNNKEK
jgi:hypothetical protein